MIGIDFARGPDVAALVLIPGPGRALPSPPEVDEMLAHLPPISRAPSTARDIRAAMRCMRALEGNSRREVSLTVKAPADAVAAAGRWLSEHVVDAFTDRATYHLGGRRHEVVRTVLLLRRRA